MARVYAVREDNGKRVLVEIVCDECKATIKPHPDIENSGWVKHGGTAADGFEFEFDYCPRCAP